MEYIISSPEYAFSKAELDYLYLRSVATANISVADYLIKIGANPAATDPRGAGAIEHALLSGNPKSLIPRLQSMGVTTREQAFRRMIEIDSIKRRAVEVR